MNAEAFFAATYSQARSKFLDAAQGAGLAVQSHRHPLTGSEGEPLFMDVSRLGAVDAKKLLLLSSACHGVEGFCGSGVQNALLADQSFLNAAKAAQVAVLFIHALNPYGFSWLRRTTHENVDLNRNWQDFSQPARLPRNVNYDHIAHAVVPRQWPPVAESESVLAAYAQQHGMKALQAALSGGQYHHPGGIFYGGQAPTWSHQTLTQALAQHGQQCAQLAWIDFHTGLGPSGHGEKIWAGPNDAAGIAQAKRWWGEGITNIYDGSSTSAPLTGMMFNAVLTTCKQAQYCGIALEYGTQPMEQVMHALRGDQWLYNHPDAAPELRGQIKRAIRGAFYVDTPQWKEQIVRQGVVAARQAVEGLAAG